MRTSGVVDPLLDVRRSWLSNTLREGVKGHSSRLAVAHQHHCAAGQQWCLDCRRVTLGHAVGTSPAQEHKDGLLFRCYRVQRSL